MSFVDLSVPPTVLRGVFTYGYEAPSKVQLASIPAIGAGQDTLVQAPSGTGKTGAFGIGVLSHLVASDHSALILCHTRELAVQTATVLGALAKYEKKISVVTCCGGLRSKTQNVSDLIKSTSFVMVATPGRCLDIFKSDTVGSSIATAVGHVVMDEADHLLQDTFVDHVREIIRLVPADAAMCVCSATMPAEVQDLATRFQKDNVVKIQEADTRALVLQGITQYYVPCPELVHKLTAVETMYRSWSVTASIIFCASRSRVDWVADQMESRGFPVARIHAGLTPAQRGEVMQQFRAGQARVLVATNLLARGIDVQTVQLVVLYDMIPDPDTYLHAIGRCGRYGRKGVSVALIDQSPEEDAMMQDMSQKFGVVPVEMPPTFQIAEM